MTHMHNLEARLSRNTPHYPFELIIERNDGSEEHVPHFTAKSAKHQAKRLVGLPSIIRLSINDLINGIVSLFWSHAQ